MKPENASNMDLVTEYTSLQKNLDQENDHWFELSQKLEELN
jgi:ATP-binding cassette subfamily F protein 3